MSALSDRAVARSRQSSAQSVAPVATRGHACDALREEGDLEDAEPAVGHPLAANIVDGAFDLIHAVPPARPLPAQPSRRGLRLAGAIGETLSLCSRRRPHRRRTACRMA